MGRREERRERGRIITIFNEIEVTTNERVNRIVSRRHGGEEERIERKIAALGVEVDVKNLKRPVGARDRGITTELNKTTRYRGKRDVTRDKVPEDVGGVNNGGTPTVHTQVIPGNNTTRERKSETLAGG